MDLTDSVGDIAVSDWRRDDVRLSPSLLVGEGCPSLCLCPKEEVERFCAESLKSVCTLLLSLS